MAFNICLQLGGSPGSPDIKGEITNVPKHGTEIECLSWSWGMTQTGSTQVGSGGGTGSADVRDLTVTKYVDSSSPILAYYCFKGQHLPTALLTCIKVGGKGGPIDYLKITMGGNDKANGAVIISSISTGEREVVNGQTTDRFLETITLNFNNVLVEYTPQKSDGTPGTTIPSNVMDILAKG